MARRLVDYDPMSREATYHHYDHSTKKTHIETVQDISQVIERNKALQNTSEYKRQGIKQDMMHFATVPNAVLMKIMKEHHISPFKKEDMPKWEKVLSSSDYRYLRTVDKI